MKKNQILLTLLLFIYIPLSAQINKNGIPLIKNYSPNDYNAAEQNWAICEDKRGVVYVGNNDDGILEFDGSTWNKIPISNGSIVRSLAYSDDDIVYVGGVDEFGYLAPDINGDMQYHSLVNQLDSIYFKDVWKIFTIDKNVYFCSDRDIYQYKNKRLTKHYRGPKGTFLSFQIDNQIYWGSFFEGLFEMSEDTFAIANGGEFYKDKDIFVMLPWSENEIFIGTNGQGVYIYNTETGLSKNFSELGKKYKKLSTILNNSFLYNGIKLNNGMYAIATLDNGCLVFNQDGKLLYKFDKENGLQDLTIINLFESGNGHLLLGLNKGISFIELSTPFNKLGPEYGIEGIILDVIRYDETLFVSTNIGLYYLDYDENDLPYFGKVPLDWSVNDLEVFKREGVKDKLIIGTSFGVWEYKSTSIEPDYISEDEYECEVLFQSKISPSKLYIANKFGLAYLEYKNGIWHDHKKVHKDITSEINSIVELHDGTLWLGTTLKGVIKLTPDQVIERYGVEQGLPDLRGNKVYEIDNQIICATKKGVYYLNTKENKFEKYQGFGEKYDRSNDEIKSIDFIKDNEFWIVLVDKDTEIEYIEKLTISQDRIVTIQNIPFKRLINNSFYTIAFDDSNGTWIGTSDAIYNYQEQLQDDFIQYYSNLIRKVEIGIDSVVFHGTFYNDTANLIVDLEQPDELKNIVKYKNNSFNFYYSTPYIPTDEVKYSYKLDGFDEDWSSWDDKTEKGYTNLNNGHYTFMVKAKNIYGIESEVVNYEFTIKPPWYKTIVAYFFYLVLAVLIIIVIVKIYTRRLELEKIRLEQIVKERTEEVVKQKEEIEQQRDEIADKNRSITDSIEYASRIQTAVLPSDEFANEILPEHFILFRPRDIVSGDFYWMTKKDNLLVVIAADCTGHGVPGAFMSMLGVSFLNEIVNRHDVSSAGAILTQLRADVKKTLGQEGKEGEAKDGMDIALCIVDLGKMKMQYAGAYNPLYLYRNNELVEVKADRMPIGIYIKEKESFTNNELDLQKGDVFYIFSDGYQDQFGGEDGSKFKTKNFKQLLLEIHQKPMAEQREILDKRIDEWRGSWEQVDDIIILGVRV